mgnify:CR=1 FL=1
MHVSRITASRFRNLSHATFHPTPGINVLEGQNGQGKTNVLEAIHALATLKSFRGQPSRELIQHGFDQASVAGTVHDGGMVRDVELLLNGSTRRVSVNGTPVRQLASYFGTINAVTFCPEDVGVFRGSPADRRLLIDRAVFNAYPAYGAEVQDYERALKNRNACLRQEPVDRSLLEVYDQQVSRHGAIVVRRRLAYLQRINPILATVFHDIFSASITLELGYVQHEVDDQNRSAAVTAAPSASLPAQDDIAERLLVALRRRRQVDLARGFTTIGPHRDDALATIDTTPMRGYASQGQHRAAILAFKISEIQLLHRIHEHHPILLMDDVSSELDPERNARLFQFVDTLDAQVFITTTNAATLQLTQPTTRWAVHAGRIEPHA